MTADFLHARNEFWRTYAVVLKSLQSRPRHQLEDLKHDAEEMSRQMRMPFSDRAAAQLVLAACNELLG